MTEDRFEAIRIIAGIIFFWGFLSMLPSKKKANSKKKSTATPQKMKSLRPEKATPQKKIDSPIATFGEITGWHADGQSKGSFFSNRKNDFYVDESVDYEASFDVGGRRKNPPMGFDR